MIICIFLENQGDKLQQQLLPSFIAQTRQSLCLIPAFVFPSPVMLKTDGERKNASKQRFQVAKPSVMTPQWKMFPHISWQRSHFMDCCQRFPLCNISLTLGQLPAPQHTGIKCPKMAKLRLMHPGRAGKERLERQERGRKEDRG